MKSAPRFYYAFPHQERNPLYINSTGSIYMELRLDRIAPWIFLHWRAASVATYSTRGLAAAVRGAALYTAQRRMEKAAAASPKGS